MRCNLAGKTFRDQTESAKCVIQAKENVRAAITLVFCPDILQLFACDDANCQLSQTFFVRFFVTYVGRFPTFSTDLLGRTHFVTIKMIRRVYLPNPCLIETNELL